VNYTVLVLRRAEKELAELPTQDYRQVIEAIRVLGDEPRPPGCGKLAGRDGWRIRVGRYRVIYEIDDKARTLTVLNVGHRKEIYR
jgi:mRNA interferase RelE/StbE